MKSSTTHQVLICSGLDPCGGAGFIADCGIVVANGARPVGVVTAHTVQNSLGVTAARSVDLDLITAQLRAILSDTPIDAVKIGMLGNAAVATAVVHCLLSCDYHPTVIWDPVMQPTRGGVALYDGEIDDLQALFRELAMVCHVIATPNTTELGMLSHHPLSDMESLRLAAVAVIANTGMSVLVKGGHRLPIDDPGDAAQQCNDWLFGRDGTSVKLAGEYVAMPAGGVHGTGCALSSAIAAQIAIGADVVTACSTAKRWVYSHILSAVAYGQGAHSIV
jgi:hydroxymethylpyrimidine/phosphomethylpyrimidine kinase